MLTVMFLVMVSFNSGAFCKAGGFAGHIEKALSAAGGAASNWAVGAAAARDGGKQAALNDGGHEGQASLDCVCGASDPGLHLDFNMSLATVSVAPAGLLSSAVAPVDSTLSSFGPVPRDRPPNQPV